MLVACAMTVAGASFAAGVDGTLFLHHFDAPVADPAVPPADADYAAGTAAVVVAGGQIYTPDKKFGAASYRTELGGRAHYVADDGNLSLVAGTIEMWVKRNSPWNDGSGRGFFGCYSAGNNDFRFYKDPSNRLGAYINKPGGIVGAEVVMPTAPTAGEWHHLALSWDTATDLFAIYVDGQNINAPRFGGAVGAFGSSVPSNQFIISAVQAGSDPWQNYMDEFRISDFARYSGQTFAVPSAPFAVPEPATMAGVVFAGLFLRRRRG